MKTRINSNYIGCLLSAEHPCEGCPAFEEIGRCGTWTGCSVMSDRDMCEQIMDFLDWDIQDIYDAVKFIEEKHKKMEKSELDRIRAKELAESTPDISITIEAYIEDDLIEDFIESLLK